MRFTTKTIIGLFFLVALVFTINLFVSHASASTLYEQNNHTPNINQVGVTWHAQTFTVGTNGSNVVHYITGVKLLLYRVGSPGNFTVSIRNTSTIGKPTATDLTYVTVNANVFTTGAGGAWYWFNFTQPIILQPSIKYAIVCSKGINAVNNVCFPSNSPSTYAGGIMSASSSGGATWANITGVDMIFEEYGNLGITSSINTITPYWHTTSSITINATVIDNQTSINKVCLFYSYSSDNVTWGGALNNTFDNVAPYSFVFSFPNSSRYYRFYTRALDNSGNWEKVSVCDMNNDGFVNSVDGVDIVAHYGETGLPGWIPEDLNVDGTISYLDTSFFVSHYEDQYNASAGYFIETASPKSHEYYEGPIPSIWYTQGGYGVSVSYAYAYEGFRSVTGSFYSIAPISAYEDANRFSFWFYMSSPQDVDIYEHNSSSPTIHFYLNSNQSVWYYDGAVLKNLSYKFNLNEWYNVIISDIDWFNHDYALEVSNANYTSFVYDTGIDFQNTHFSLKSFYFIGLDYDVFLDDISTDAPSYISSYSPLMYASTSNPFLTAVVNDYDNTVIVPGEHIELQYLKLGTFIWTTSPITYTGSFPKTCTWNLTGLIYPRNTYKWRLSNTYDYGYMPYLGALSYYQFNYLDATPPICDMTYPTNGSTIIPSTWKNHDITFTIYDPDTYYDIGFAMKTGWSNYYMFTVGNNIASPYYNSSLHHQIGYTNITLHSEDWVPFYDYYQIHYDIWETGGTNISGTYSFTISGSKHYDDTVSLRGFLPVDGNMNQYNRVGQNIWYWIMNNRTDGTPTPHEFLTDETGKILKQHHNDQTNWNKVPIYDIGKYSVFEVFPGYANQIKVDHTYNFYIGFSQDFWTSSNLDIQLLYDSGSILNFSGNNGIAGLPTNIYDNDHEAFDYWGVKITFGTSTSASAMTGTGTSEGEQTGGTWGINLGTQIDNALGISGMGIVIGLFVLAIFSLMPLLILKHVPPLPIMIFFTDFGAIFSYAIGLFPLWFFFVIVVIVVLFLVYRLRSWIMQGTQMQDVTDNQGEGIVQRTGTLRKSSSRLGKTIMKGVKKLTK